VKGWNQMTERHRRGATAIAAVTLATAGLALAGLGCGEKTLVCVDKPAHVALIASTSKTDYELSAELAPTVGRKVMQYTARSCGDLMVGIQDGRPDSNLNLVEEHFEPRSKEAFNPGKMREDMYEEGEEFLAREFLGPLDKSKPIGGSPFFASVAKTRHEAAVHGWPPPTIVLIGDGFVVERSPQTNKMVRFGQEPITKPTLTEFTNLLGDLKGTCVIVAGFGGDSNLPPQKIRETERLLAEAFESAGAKFLATRSSDLEPECHTSGSV
jgi:hypothetical protein